MEFNLRLLLPILASCNVLLVLSVFVKLRQPTTLAFWAIKIFVSALSTIWLLAGIILMMLSGLFHSSSGMLLGAIGTVLVLIHIVRIIGPIPNESNFEKAFGEDYMSLIPKNSIPFFLTKRYVFVLSKSPKPVFREDIVFHKLSDGKRGLLCDIWQPPKQVKRSGLAFIYLHGSAWSVWDKNKGTRTFFSHLASQGHVVMDVAYRLFPETDMKGMVQDAYHAIAWMKANADTYGIDPNRIVLGGGSAGGHLALLAAYAASGAYFLPEDLQPFQVKVKGVISLYGPTDLKATYYYCRQDLLDAMPKPGKVENESAGIPSWLQKRMGKNYHRLGFDKNVEPGMLSPMLGGNPIEQPEAYALFSPVTYVHNNCPKTLLIQGAHDILVSPESTMELCALLDEKKIPAILHILPQTDHAFDLILPRISPSAHTAIFDIERFLGVMAFEGQ